MKTKLISTAPSQGELAEQRHLLDPLDHVWEHLADEDPAEAAVAGSIAAQFPLLAALRATEATLSPKREAEIVARLDDEERTASELTDIVTELLTEVDRLREWVAELEGENAKLIRWHREDGSALAKLAARPSRAEVLREAADAIVAENDRALWATRPGKHWAADLLRGMARKGGGR